MVTHSIPHHKLAMVPHASIISENEASITALFACYVRPVTQQHESRTVGKVRLYQSSHYEKCG